jgi:flagellar basal body-associated protein FliL
MTVTLGEDLIPLFDQMSELLNKEPDLRVRQQILELLSAHHAARMGTLDGAFFVVDGMSKHIKQILKTSQ